MTGSYCCDHLVTYCEKNDDYRKQSKHRKQLFVKPQSTMKRFNVFGYIAELEVEDHFD
jgi:hypothetical protein